MTLHLTRLTHLNAGKQTGKPFCRRLRFAPKRVQVNLLSGPLKRFAKLQQLGAVIAKLFHHVANSQFRRTMSDLEDSNDDDGSVRKRGKKKYYPFGTPTHSNNAYSKFAHIHNPQTQEFASLLASPTRSFEVHEPAPEKRAKRRPASPPKKSGKKGDAAKEADDPATIPDTEGLEPCMKIPCQQVLRAIADIKYKNEVERDEIEDEYERLLQELAATEQEIAAAEAKFVLLNDISGQLETRANQLNDKANALQNTKETQDNERNDINGKLMVLQTEKSKRSRGLEKAIKALSDATWRKKKKAQMDNVEAGLSMATSEISDAHIVHTDASTVSSLSGIYKTAYGRLAADRVRDHIELPPSIKTLPPYMMDVLAKPELEEDMDKYTKKHYQKLLENGVRSWEGMEGSLFTASIYSASSHGHGPQILAQSYDEYSQIRAKMSTTSSITTAASSRVGSILQSRQRAGSPSSVRSQQTKFTGNGSSLHTSQSLAMLSRLVHSPRDTSPSTVKNVPFRSGNSTVGNSSKVSKSSKRTSSQKSVARNQIRLAPLNNTGMSGRQQSDVDGNIIIGESGFDGLSLEEDEMDGFLYEGQPNVRSHSHSGRGGASVQSVSAYSGFNGASIGDSATQVTQQAALDPVFFKEQSRNHWGRKHAVGKLRRAEITWGMKTFVDPEKFGEEDGDDGDDYSTGGASTRLRRQGLSGLSTHTNNTNITVSKKIQQMHAGANSNALSRTGTAQSLRYGHTPSPSATSVTVKSRSLTVYHPDMQIFQDAATLPKKKSADNGN